MQALLPWAALALLAVLVYLPALGAGFIWDDQALTENPLVAAPGGLWRIWLTPALMPQEQHYWPLVYSSFWLEHLLAGLNPFIYHLDNVLLHGAACVLLWRVLRRLAVPGAWLAAALFAVHPVHAESVAWVIERKDVLCGALVFGAALAFLRFHDLPAAAPPRRRWRIYALSLALFAAALLSKSAAVGLPVTLALALWLRNGRLTRRDLLALAPLALLAAALALADLSYFSAHQETGVETSGLALPERVLVAGRAIWIYLLKLALPYPLATYYPKWPAGRGLLAALPLLAWLALLAGLWLARRRVGRGAFAALAFFGVLLAPMLGVMDFEYMNLTWVADRFQYLASAGPLALAAAGALLLAERLRWSEAARRYGAAALLAALGLLGLRQAARYHDSVTLFQASAAAYPQCWPAHSNLSWALGQAGRSEEALQALNDGLRQMPAPEYHLTHDLAQAMEERQRPADAEQYYQETLRLKPGFVSAHINYGNLLADLGRPGEAEAHFREALRLSPASVGGLSNLVSVLRQQNKLEEAANLLAEMLKLAPRRADVHAQLALVRFEQEQYPQALEACRQALRLDPYSFVGTTTLGQILLAQGKAADALAPLTQAAQLQPASPDPWFLLGESHAALRDAAEAVRCYQEALRRQPNHPGAAERLQALGAPAP